MGEGWDWERVVVDEVRCGAVRCGDGGLVIVNPDEGDVSLLWLWGPC